ncbi:hypothetical protein HOLleu_10796 [Holothuria leucospilota]|uniref:EGF-like domain-containing protein n=1 Tax=Holothuria leucospilota TaxID=206669 RepID=A0A9Q1HG04_HOLLE|nr:hypothetical protein HOLleu_10796 [Holothuria leucospilota]
MLKYFICFSDSVSSTVVSVSETTQSLFSSSVKVSPGSPSFVNLCIENNPCDDDADCYSLRDRVICVCKSGKDGENCVGNEVSKTPNVLELVFVDNWWVGGTFMLVMVLTLILLMCLLASCLCDFSCMRRRSEVHLDGSVARNGSIHHSA